MMNFEQRLGDLVRCITGLKRRTDHGGIIHPQIMVD